MAAPYAVQNDTTGLSFWYRLRWRATYTLLFFLGPAERPPHADPRHILRRERAEKLLENYAAAGQEPPEDLYRIARTGR